MQVEERNEGGRLEPVLAGTGRPVAEVVHALHEATIDVGLERLAIPGLTRETLELVLVYCAEQRCAAAGATCPGCRRRSDQDGLTSFDAFVAAHGEIAIGDGRVRLEGPGERRLAAASLEALQRTWAGEEYWFWARRVLRKLWHGIRRAHIQGSAVAPEGATPAVILMEPQLAENIGMVARAMANFGLDELRLVAPRDGWPNEKARIAASGANYIVDDARAYPSLEAAIGDVQWLAATTARQRDLRKPVLTPAQAVAEMRRRIGEGQRCAVLFGRERNGLETIEVAAADALVMVPVNSRFASLNLAQAVLILGYDWMREAGAATLGRVTTYEEALAPGLNMGDDRPATKEEMLGFFEHLEAELEAQGFFNPGHRRATFVRHMRTMFTRAALTEQEVRTLRGIVATLVKGKGTARKAP